jgi:Mrp family chromosome partitioning ATPase
VIVRITADSKLKLMPDMATLMHRMEGGAEGAARRVDMTQMMEDLQPAKFDDLTVGSGVMVTSAKGGSDDSITAITLLAKADLLLKMMQPAGRTPETPMWKPCEECTASVARMRRR